MNVVHGIVLLMSLSASIASFIESLPLVYAYGCRAIGIVFLLILIRIMKPIKQRDIPEMNSLQQIHLIKLYNDSTMKVHHFNNEASKYNSKINS